MLDWKTGKKGGQPMIRKGFKPEQIINKPPLPECLIALAFPSRTILRWHGHDLARMAEPPDWHGGLTKYRYGT
jgi:hypothetical protein